MASSGPVARPGVLQRVQIAASNVKNETSAQFQELREHLRSSRHLIAELERECELYRNASADFAAANHRFNRAVQRVAQAKGIDLVLGEDGLRALTTAQEQLGAMVGAVVPSVTNQLMLPLRGRVTPEIEHARALKSATYAAVHERNKLAERIAALGSSSRMDSAMRAAQSHTVHAQTAARCASLQAEAIAAMRLAEDDLRCTLAAALVENTAAQAGAAARVVRSTRDTVAAGDAMLRTLPDPHTGLPVCATPALHPPAAAASTATGGGGWDAEPVFLSSRATPPLLTVTTRSGGRPSATISALLGRLTGSVVGSSSSSSSGSGTAVVPPGGTAPSVLSGAAAAVDGRVPGGGAAASPSHYAPSDGASDWHGMSALQARLGPGAPRNSRGDVARNVPGISFSAPAAAAPGVPSAPSFSSLDAGPGSQALGSFASASAAAYDGGAGPLDPLSAAAPGTDSSSSSSSNQNVSEAAHMWLPSYIPAAGVHLLGGEAVVAHAEGVVDDVTGALGSVIATNYRIRWFPAVMVPQGPDAEGGTGYVWSRVPSCFDLTAEPVSEVPGPGTSAAAGDVPGGADSATTSSSSSRSSSSADRRARLAAMRGRAPGGAASSAALALLTAARSSTPDNDDDDADAAAAGRAPGEEEAGEEDVNTARSRSDSPRWQRGASASSVAVSAAPLSPVPSSSRVQALAARYGGAVGTPGYSTGTGSSGGGTLSPEGEEEDEDRGASPDSQLHEEGEGPDPRALTAAVGRLTLPAALVQSPAPSPLSASSSSPSPRVLYRKAPYATFPLLCIAQLEVVGGPRGSLVVRSTDLRCASLSFASATADAASLLAATAPLVWTARPQLGFPAVYRLPPPLPPPPGARPASESPPLDGWRLFTITQEWARLSAASPSGWGDRWRVSGVNTGYKLCGTYPQQLIMPAGVPDDLAMAAGKFRSKRRLPAVTWFHGSVALARASQPLSGMFGARSAEDERLVEALLADPADPSTAAAPAAFAAATAPTSGSSRSSSGGGSGGSGGAVAATTAAGVGMGPGEGGAANGEAPALGAALGLPLAEAAAPPFPVAAAARRRPAVASISSSGNVPQAVCGGYVPSLVPSEDGSQLLLAILDARPRVNAIANRTKGGGAEAIGAYRHAGLAFLGIDNIHVVRDALKALRGRLLSDRARSLQRELMMGFAPPAPSAFSATAPSSASAAAGGAATFPASIPRPGGPGRPSAADAPRQSFAESLGRTPSFSGGWAASSRPSNVGDLLEAAVDGNGERVGDGEAEEGGAISRQASRAADGLGATGGGLCLVDAEDFDAEQAEGTLAPTAVPHPPGTGLRAMVASVMASSLSVSSSTATSGGGGMRRAASFVALAQEGPGSSGSGGAPSALGEPLPGVAPAAPPSGASLRRSQSFALDSSSSGGSSSAAGGAGRPPGATAGGGGATGSITRMAAVAERLLKMRPSGGGGGGSAAYSSAGGDGGTLVGAAAAAAAAAGPGGGNGQIVWLRLLSVLLRGAVRVAEHLACGVSVLVHCSDGWDRTAGLTSLAQLMVDPFYRTLHGFAVLVEKEWVAYGHRFAKRCGTGGCGYDRAAHEDDQRAPIFLQWVDAVWQVWRQAPAAFQFNDRLLVALAEHAYSGRFGTFLLDCDKDRTEARLADTTVSLWSYVLHPDHVAAFANPAYSPPPGYHDGGAQLGGGGAEAGEGGTGTSMSGGSGSMPAPPPFQLGAHVILPHTSVEALAVWSHWAVRWT